MIKTKNDLAEYIQADAAANGRISTKAALFGDEIWKFLLSLRRLEYCSNQSGMLGRILIPLRLLHQYRYHRLSVLLNFTIPVNVADKGLAIVHYGSIIVSKGARIGQNCRIHEGVTIGATNNHYVFMVPVEQELDLKKAAKAVGEKSIAMIKSKELLPLTGYIHGGCSPIGMKKQFKTTIHMTAADFDTFIFSAGKIGYQVELSLEELKKVLRFELADIIV